MARMTVNRRDVLKGGATLAATTVFASPLRAAPPPAEAITPALIEAAKKEGAVTFYTAMDLAFAERLGRVFEQKFAGINVHVERSGAERVFQRIGQEYRATFTPLTSSTPPISRTSSTGSGRAGWRPTCRTMSSNITTRNTTIPTASRSSRAFWCRRSASTPIW